MPESKIEWTDATWNPVSGCSKVSEGCRNCYAMRDAHRMGGHGNPRISAAYGGLTRATPHGAEWTGDVRTLANRLSQPLEWRRPRRVFVNSMSDLFHPSVPNDFIAAVFGVMAACPHHTFQILSKRPERAAEWFAWAESNLEGFVSFTIAELHEGGHFKTGCGSAFEPAVWPLRNVWFGVSAENQPAADERIPRLLRIPAAVRFVSAEPLLGPVDLRPWLPCHDLRGDTNCARCVSPASRFLNWVIAGGESGLHARPMHPHWLRNLRDQCNAAGVAFFFKQWGEWVPCPDDEWHGLGPSGKPKQAVISPDGETAGGFISATLAERRKIEGWRAIQRIGKKAAGRELDGRTWDEMPAGQAVSRG